LENLAMNRSHVPLAAAMCLALAAPAALAQAGRDACVEKLRETGGPDAQNGVEVLDTQWSQAGTLVTMRDAGGTVWVCLGYDDGAAEVPTVVDAADDGGGAMAVNPAREGPENDGDTTTVQVKFSARSSGATYDGSLSRGSSTRYVLGARDGQFLDVQVSPGGPGISYLVDAGLPYRGQLWQSGDHVVEVYNRGDATASYRVVFCIE
jgi:hypothetical protein